MCQLKLICATFFEQVNRRTEKIPPVRIKDLYDALHSQWARATIPNTEKSIQQLFLSREGGGEEAFRLRFFRHRICSLVGRVYVSRSEKSHRVRGFFGYCRDC